MKEPLAVDKKFREPNGFPFSLERAVWIQEDPNIGDGNYHLRRDWGV